MIYVVRKEGTVIAHFEASTEQDAIGTFLSAFSDRKLTREHSIGSVLCFATPNGTTYQVYPQHLDEEEG